MATRNDYFAQYKARRNSERNDIAPLPRVRDMERRRRCAASLVEFAAHYGGAVLAHAPSDALRTYAETLQRAIEGAGQVHVRMARGAGKTSWVKAALAWGLATGRLHYAVVFCASSELAQAVIADVWAILASGGAFAEDWPEIAHPILRAGGVTQRFASQHYRGVPTAMRKSAREIRLPTIPGAPSSGGVLLARGAGAKTRGLVRGTRRPDIVLLDDIQSRYDALNPRRIRRLADWIDGDVQGLSGERLLNAVMTSTPIVAGDLSAQYADAAEHPGWQLVEFPLVGGAPQSPQLWDEYDARWRSAQRDGDMTFGEATEFYRAHRDEMDSGLTILDPLKFDSRVELSAIQHARNQRLIMGAEAFRAECQLEVRATVEGVQITPALVASRLHGFPRGTIPEGCFSALAFIDVNIAAGLSYTVAAYGPNGRAAVVDYGRVPGGNRRLVPEGATEDDAERLVAAALSALVRSLLDRSFPMADGRTLRLSAVWIDAGYRRKTVQTVCTVFRARTGRAVWASVGVAHDRYNAHSRHVIQSGDGVDHRALDGERWFAHDADRWREWVQRAWLGAPLMPGTYSLPGDNRRDHAEYSEEVCSETLAEKITDSRNITHYFWNARPGASNHWLDTLTGCTAAAAWYRLLDSVAVAPAERAATGAAQSATRQRPRFYSARKQRK